MADGQRVMHAIEICNSIPKKWKRSQYPACHASRKVDRAPRRLCALNIFSSIASRSLQRPQATPSPQQQRLSVDVRQPYRLEPQPGVPTAGDDPTPALSSNPNPGASPNSSSSSGPGPGPSQQPDGPGGPEGGGMPLQLRYLILLLAEYGGVYGTAAIVIAALTHVDAFGGLHWDANDVALGLGLMAPAMAFDAIVGLPDWSTQKADAEALVRIFVDPDLLRSPKTGEEQSVAKSQQAGSAGGQPKLTEERETSLGASLQSTAQSKGTHEGGDLSQSVADLPVTTSSDGNEGRSSSSGGVAAREEDGIAGVGLFSRSRPDFDDGEGAGPSGRGAVRLIASFPSNTGRGATTATSSAASAATDAPSSSSTSGSIVSPVGGGRQPGGLWAVAQRLRMALELMQESSVRNNPGARLTHLQEAVLILFAVTADEMLYRAVLLTLFGRWLRDRAYEAGAEEVLAFPGGLQLDTAAAAQWAALVVGLTLGAAVFAAKAWQESRVAERLRAVQTEQAEEAAKELRKQRLLGHHPSEAELREEQEKQARLQAAQASLAASIGVQGALVWSLEGGREVAQVAAAGASFLLTGNLAAPLAGGLAAQLLVSFYQRLRLRRVMQRRAKEIEARRRTALEQQQHQRTAAAAAVSEGPAAEGSLKHTERMGSEKEQHQRRAQAEAHEEGELNEVGAAGANRAGEHRQQQ